MKSRFVYRVEQLCQSLDGPIWLVVSRHKREFAANHAAHVLRAANGHRTDVRVRYVGEEVSQ
jgi:hypothetical protein